MRYGELIQRITRLSGVPDEDVRAVLYHMPDALLALLDGSFVRTPLGVFRTRKSRARLVVPPNGTQKVAIPESTVIRLKGGVRLRRD